jgi:hypothetical protein
MTTRKPCTGPKALTKVERWHGPEVIQLALWDGSPRSWKYDPATAALRLGFRQNRFQSHKPFNDQLPADVNLGLLKVPLPALPAAPARRRPPCAPALTARAMQAAYRGQAHLIPAFLEEGADINFVAKAKTGAAAELVGLSPLSAAAHQGHIDSVHLLLAKGGRAVRLGEGPLGVWGALARGVSPASGQERQDTQGLARQGAPDRRRQPPYAGQSQDSARQGRARREPMSEERARAGRGAAHPFSFSLRDLRLFVIKRI